MSARVVIGKSIDGLQQTSIFVSKKGLDCSSTNPNDFLIHPLFSNVRPFLSGVLQQGVSIMVTHGTGFIPLVLISGGSISYIDTQKVLMTAQADSSASYSLFGW